MRQRGAEVVMASCKLQAKRGGQQRRCRLLVICVAEAVATFSHCQHCSSASNDFTAIAHALFWCAALQPTCCGHSSPCHDRPQQQHGKKSLQSSNQPPAIAQWLLSNLQRRWPSQGQARQEEWCGSPAGPSSLSLLGPGSWCRVPLLLRTRDSSVFWRMPKQFLKTERHALQACLLSWWFVHNS